MTTPFFNCTYPLMCVHTSHDLMGIHLLRCVHNNEHIKTHDGIRDTFVAIVGDVGFPMGWKQLHALPSITFNSSCRWIDIVFTKYGIHTLVDVIIVDPMWMNLFHRFCATQGFVTLDVVQAKERSYHNQQPIDQFLLLGIKVFGCLHKHDDVFLHYCANAMWSLKMLKGLHLFTLVIFLCQKISITLQKMQTPSILSWVIVVGLTSWNFHPFRTHLSSPWLIYYKLLVFDINIWLTCHRGLILNMERFWHPCWAIFISNNFSLFIFFTPLYIFQIYRVFFYSFTRFEYK